MLLSLARKVVAFSFIASSAALGQEVVTGTLTVVWDGNTRQGSTASYYLADGKGTVIELDPSSLGRDELRLQSYDRTKIQVRVVSSQSGVATLRIGRMLDFRPIGMPTAFELSATVSPRPFVFVLCRFGDDASTPFAKEQVELVVGPTYPGMAHFYSELSEDPAVMSGNRVIDWVNLQKPRSAYVDDAAFTTNTSELARDCTAAADAQVDFTQYSGIALQMNGALARRNVAPFDTISLGGGVFLTLDGQSRVWGAAWFSASHMGNYVVYSHELGHGLGWPHSSGNYGKEYDSNWDVMSSGYVNFTQAFRWVPIHTIMPYKRRAGWIPDDRILTTAQGASATGTIVRSALGGSSSYRMARIPISDTSEYVVESRGIAGYDAKLPAEAVVIHEVIRGRAYVVDSDNNGNPNDEAAIWRAGESFIDETHRITVSVLTQSSSGSSVRIQRGAAPVTISSQTVRKSGVISVPYADTVAASGGIGVFTWTLIEGAFPDGLALNATTGVISGTPTRPAQYAFALRATSGGEIADKAFNTTIFAGVTIVSDSTRRLGLTGSPYADTLTAVGGNGVFTWARSAGSLPVGLSLSANGIVAGTPGTAGDFRYTVTATSTGVSASRTMHVVVANPLLITSDSVRRLAVLGASYADTLSATGGTSQARWRLISGKLPDGLALDTLTATISGVPAKAGAFAFVVSATSGTLVVNKGLAISATAPAIQATGVLDQLLGSGSMTANELRYLDMVGNNNSRFDVGDVRGWLIATSQMSVSGVLVEPALADVRLLQSLAGEAKQEQQTPKK